jgi:hypothetical protein
MPSEKTGMADPAKLLLRPDAYYAQTADGAHILTHQGERNFTGRSVYQLLDRLAPFLNGQHTLAELTADLAPGRREMVQNLLTKLLESGVVRETRQAGADEEMPGTHRHEIAYAGYFRDRPIEVFGAYQDTATVVFGAGELCDAVVAAAARSGLRDVRVVTTADDHQAGTAGRAAAPRPWAGERRSLGPGLSREETENAIRPLLDGVGLVLHACDRPMVEHARLLDRLCREAGIQLAQVTVVGDAVWYTSAGAVRGEGTSWTSGWRRLMARDPAQPRADASDSSHAAPSGLPVAVVAGQFVHGVFRSFVRPAELVKHQLTRVDLSSLTSEVCAFVPHPFEAPVPSGPRADLTSRVEELRGGARLGEEEFSQRAVLCTGDRTGIFANPSERDFAQLPLHVCEIELSDPVGLLDPAVPPTPVTGAGPDFATARYRAALKAFASYSSLMLDPRRLIVTGDPAVPRTDPDGMLSALRSGRLTGRVPGYGLTDGKTHLLDAAQVFPALRASDRPYTTPPGTAAAYSWDEAVAAGVIDQCLRITLRDLAESNTPFAQVDLRSAVLDAPGDRYRALLAAVGEPVTVYDVTGPLGVPVMLCYLGSTPAGCAASLSAAGALTDSLEQVLLFHQARENGQSGYAPPPVDGIPERFRGDTVRTLSDDPPRDTRALASALLERGNRPVAVPLDHDPEVNAIMPYVVRVVVTDG